MKNTTKPAIQYSLALLALLLLLGTSCQIRIVPHTPSDGRVESRSQRLRKQIRTAEALGNASNQMASNSAAAYILGEAKTPEPYIATDLRAQLQAAEEEEEAAAYRRAVYQITGKWFPEDMKIEDMRSLLPTLLSSQPSRTGSK